MTEQEREQKIWNFFMKKLGNEYAVAGLMGNLFAESGLNPMNLQNTGNKKLGMTDEQYVKAVDNGSYKNFVRDSQGFGLAQWTYYTRKQELLNFAKSKGASIGDLKIQMKFLWKELKDSYPAVVSFLKKIQSVREASDIVLLKFERPADQSAVVRQKRTSYSCEIFKRHVK